jgi:hypothetical protein
MVIALTVALTREKIHARSPETIATKIKTRPKGTGDKNPHPSFQK